MQANDGVTGRRNISILGLVALVPLLGLASAVVIAATPWTGGRVTRPPEGSAPMVRVLGQRRPETAEPYLRAWWMHREGALGVAYTVVPQRVPMHVHLDADHVLVVVEGRAVVQVGGARTDMAAGDVLAIPRGMAHEVRRAGSSRLVIVDVTAPPGDMDKTFWIESPAEVVPGMMGEP